ncbi:CLUMA_CG005914, isoform A [Clunio marinus]|uniref:ATP-dependent DNA helicase n=1 Tax=Clunio marinus TaxID=568069 RepID=A0A1J1I0J3_9DIPT|nr:CLUMA_CG005914, isoform A [Clunio marinus]
MAHLEEPSAEHLKVLKEKFGHKCFKKEQWNIMRSLMYEKRDCCVIASTGFGKSLIYQFPPVFMNKLTVVISPLIALMQDQVLALKQKGIKACYFGSQQFDKTLRMCDHNVVYITPEYYFGRGKREIEHCLYKVMMFAVDEAHILEQWKDFRPTYRRLGEIRTDFPKIPCIALTATAPKYVEDYIIKSLHLTNYTYLRTALDRPNLSFETRRKHNGGFLPPYPFNLLFGMVEPHYANDVLPFLQKIKDGSAIVYCLQRQVCEDMAKELQQHGIDCKPYHAGMKADARQQVVKDFRSNKLRFVICTIAFGMGIDKPDVRLVIHYGPSKSIEAYYQEAGRAGRDGKPSSCILFYEGDDYVILHHLIELNKKTTTLKEREQQHELVNRMKAFIESTKCRRLEMLEYLGANIEEMKKITIRENCCDRCIRHLESPKVVPLKFLFYEIDENGLYDFTKDAELVLKIATHRLLRNNICDILMGILPTRLNFQEFKLHYFGRGASKDRDWWDGLVSLLLTTGYLELKGNVVVPVRAKAFRREFQYFNNKILLPPSVEMRKCLKKKDDMEVFWNNGKVESRCREILEESEDEIMERKIKKEIDSLADIIFDDDDEDMEKENQQMIIEETMQNKIKQELESLKNIIIDDDEEMEIEQQFYASKRKMEAENMATVPLLDDFGDEFNDETSPDQLRHPYVTLFHIFFRSSAIVVYLFFTPFISSFITSFVFIVLLLSADFWTVKNITGRILVGLRWWNYIDNDGKSIWIYESRDKNQHRRNNTREVRIFWLGLILAPVFWGLFFLAALFGFNFKWLLLVMIALALNFANLHGYTRCKFGSSTNLKDATFGFAKKEVLKNLLSNAQPPVNAPNNTGVV